MRLLLSTLLLFKLAPQICHAAAMNFWESMEAHAHDFERQAEKKFLDFGYLPYDGPSAQLPVQQKLMSGEGFRALAMSPPQRHASSSSTASTDYTMQSRAHMAPRNKQRLTTADKIAYMDNGFSGSPVRNLLPFRTTDRMAILKEVIQNFELQPSKAKEATAYPYKGSMMTPDLAKEAMGARTTLLAEWKKDIFVVPSARTGPPPYYTPKEGRMFPEKGNEHLMYVWIRSPPEDGHGSIFQLVGLVETSVRSETILWRWPRFKTERKFVKFGSDWVLDSSPFTRWESNTKGTH